MKKLILIISLFLLGIGVEAQESNIIGEFVVENNNGLFLKIINNTNQNISVVVEWGEPNGVKGKFGPFSLGPKLFLRLGKEQMWKFGNQYTILVRGNGENWFWLFNEDGYVQKTYDDLRMDKQTHSSYWVQPKYRSNNNTQPLYPGRDPLLNQIDQMNEEFVESMDGIIEFTEKLEKEWWNKKRTRKEWRQELIRLEARLYQTRRQILYLKTLPYSAVTNGKILGLINSQAGLIDKIAHCKKMILQSSYSY